MSDFLPTQPPGPGPTDAPLPTFQSYSAYVTSTYDYVTTITRIAYDPQGTLPPSLNLQTINGQTTSIGYSVVNIPLLYDGPLPPPPLGTLYTTANQRIAPSPTNQPGNGGNGNGSPSQTNEPSGGNSGSNAGAGGQGSGQGSSNGGAGNGSNNSGGSNSSGGNNSNGVNNGQGSGSNNGGTNNGAGSNANGSGTGNGSSNGSNQAGGQGSNNGAGPDGNGAGSNNGAGPDGNGAGSNNGNNGGADNGANNGSGTNGNSGGGGDSGNGGNAGAGTGGGMTGTESSPAVTTSPTSGTMNPAALSSSASLASVAASNAASSASAASVAASNAAESSAASLASQSAVSQASSASLESVSASSLSATPSGTSSSSQPTDSSTNGGIPGANTPNSNFAKNGLSGGQIAGIVIGVLAAVLLALLLCLCCARRRRRKQNEEAAAFTGGAMPFGRKMKRRVSDRWANGWSRSGSGPNGGSGPGAYSSLGAGAGAAALGAGAGAAAAAGRGSLRSDEWEEDHLDGGNGSGFFVVGGNRTGSQNPFSHEDDDEMREYGNAAPSSSNNKTGLGKAAGLAGLGAGLAAAFGAGKRRRSSGKGKEADHAPLATNQHEADLADHHAHQQDDDAERHGLMENVDADMTADMTGDASEMQQAGPSGWTRSPAPPSHSKAGLGTAAALGAGAAGAYYAGKHRGDKDDRSGDEMSSVAGAAPVSTTSNAQRSSVTGLNTTSDSGVGSAYGSGSGSGTNPSSNSTGQRTSNSTFTGYSRNSPALIPPPSAPRGERQMYTFGNLPPRYSGAEQQQGRAERIPSFTGGFGDGDLGMFGHRSAADSYQDMDDNERNLAYAAAAAAAAAGGGASLSALASQHRDSNQGTPYLGASGNDERYSRFISRDTPLLGPGATHADITEKDEKDTSAAGPSTFGRSDSLGHHGRLPTIHSVGEFGERSNDAPASTMNQSSQSGTNTTRSGGYGSGGRGQGSTFYSPALPQTSQSMNSLGAVTAEEGFDDNQDPFSNDAAVNTTESDQNAAKHHAEGYQDEETAAGALAGAGLLGSLASGWRKLTGNTTSQPSSTAGKGAEGSGGDTTTENVENSGNASMQRGISRDSSADVHHRDPSAQRMLGDPDIAAEVQSQRASVQHANGSNLGHAANETASPIIRSGDGRSPSSSAKSGNGSGGSGAETRPQTLAEEVEEDVQGDPYIDDGNDADDEDAIGDRSKTSIITGAGVGALAAAGAKGKQSSQAKSSSDDPYDHASTTNESSMLAVRNPTEEEHGRPSMDTALSRAATTGTYSSSMQTHSQSQPSEESSSRRTQQSSSGASTGAASYSPSYLARHPSGSTRGGAGGSSSLSSRGARGGGTSSRRQGTTNEESEYTSSSGQQRRETSTIDSGDGRSSMATAGGMADEGYRNSREPGSLARVQEDEDITGYNLEGERNEVDLPSTPYYPSESLGAAVRRRAEQEARQEEAKQYGSGGSDQTSTSPQQQLSSISTTPRAIPLSLRPGGNPSESSQWRQSPRVDAVSQRAARNAASMERQHHPSQSGSGSTMAATSPRQEEETNLPTESQQQQQSQQQGEAEDDENRRTAWPKFLRF